MLVAFDTETTGLPDWRAPSDAAQQPHLVQIAVILAEDDGTERAAVNLIVQPDQWVIPPEIAKIHGITQEIADRCGVSEALAVQVWADLALGAQHPKRSLEDRRQANAAPLVIAHNESFDWRIMRIAMLRVGYTRDRIEQIEKGTPRCCTMKMASAVMKLPPTEKMVAAGFNTPKPPNLGECVRHFFKEDHAGAHDAMADARACLRLYLHLRREGMST